MPSGISDFMQLAQEPPSGQAAPPRAVKGFVPFRRRAHAPETWLKRQKARLTLLWRALWPSGADARGIVLASVRRRALRRRIGGTQEDQAAHEIDTLRYQEWIDRFDTLQARDRKAIKAHIEAAGFPVPLVLMIFDADSARFALPAVVPSQNATACTLRCALCLHGRLPRRGGHCGQASSTGRRTLYGLASAAIGARRRAGATRVCSPRRGWSAAARARALLVSCRR